MTGIRTREILRLFRSPVSLMMIRSKTKSLYYSMFSGGLNRFYRIPTSPSASVMAQNIQLFGPREGFLTHQGSSLETNKSGKYYDETKIRTRQKQRVATVPWRCLGCRTTPLEHWSKRKPTVELRWAKQQAKQLRRQPTKINSFMAGPSLSVTPDPPACN